MSGFILHMNKIQSRCVEYFFLSFSPSKVSMCCSPFTAWFQRRCNVHFTFPHGQSGVLLRENTQELHLVLKRFGQAECIVCESFWSRCSVICGARSDVYICSVCFLLFSSWSLSCMRLLAKEVGSFSSCLAFLCHGVFKLTQLLLLAPHC